MLSLASFRPSRVHLPTHLPSARFCYPRFPWFLATAVLCGLCLLPGSRKPDRSLRLPCTAFRASRPLPRRAPERRFVSHLSASGRSRLRHQLADSPQHAAASGSSSYGQFFLFRLHLTPPLVDTI